MAPLLISVSDLLIARCSAWPPPFGRGPVTAFVESPGALVRLRAPGSGGEGVTFVTFWFHIPRRAEKGALGRGWRAGPSVPPPLASATVAELSERCTRPRKARDPEGSLGINSRLI